MSTGTERRKPDGVRVRMMVDALLEAIAQLEKHRANDRRDLNELAVLLGRLEALESLEAEAEETVDPPAPPGSLEEIGRLDAGALEAARSAHRVGSMDYPPNVEVRKRRGFVGKWVIRRKP